MTMLTSNADESEVCTDLHILLKNIEAAVPHSYKIHGLTHDSRAVLPGMAFFALEGERTHGLSYVHQAVERGAAVVVFEPSEKIPCPSEIGVPLIPVPQLSQQLGIIADRFYGNPSDHLEAIAVTGTNGKTSCTHFLSQAVSGAVIGTLGWGVPGALSPTQHTTPDALEIHSILFQLRRMGYRTVAIETSSHGLVQHRLQGIRFKGAIFTNFTHDHLDYHGTLEAYREAKLSLLRFPSLEFVVFNADDPISPFILERVSSKIVLIGFSRYTLTDFPSPLITISSVKVEQEGLSFTICYKSETAVVSVPVVGDFNVENVTAVIAALIAQGHSLESASTAVKQISAVSGRMEKITGAGRTVIVDYAHTPDALDRVLSSIRPCCPGKIRIVFGCGGNRDRSKRAEMGAIAEKWADTIVLTDDNPRWEDGDCIIQDILSGCSNDNVVIMRDRKQAILLAIEQARSIDVVLVAGKGHESTQEIAGQKIPFSDPAIIRTILAQLA